ncbi:hypothetical protein WICPIJ_004970 [Wickerhamomyces pijperi]|uniref:Uncharacterized protein n=1 Tax=Wickerhamomyces pijperi TaxID=599730 RepID=A0A9P8Q4R7_WICPI|nr:hypothetical protein WICPIJ_004970 [Wickerhamomyces pijperi]
MTAPGVKLDMLVPSKTATKLDVIHDIDMHVVQDHHTRLGTVPTVVDNVTKYHTSIGRGDLDSGGDLEKSMWWDVLCGWFINDFQITQSGEINV